MKKIFTKILWGYLAVILLLSFVITLFVFGTVKEFYRKNLVQDLININHSVDYAILPILKSGDYHNLDSVVKILGNDIEARITIINPHGIVLADSKSDPLKMENHSDRPEVIKAFSFGSGSVIRHSYTINRDMLYVAVLLKDKGQILAVSRVSIFMVDFDFLIDSLKYNIAEVIVIITIIALLLAFILSRTLSNPLKNLVNVVKKVSKGDFGVRAMIKNDDEIGLLAESFNNMVDNTKTLFTEINKQKDELNSIIKSIQEGLVVINKEERISLCNESFIRMFGIEDVLGKFYWEIIRNNQVYDLVKKVLSESKNLSVEVRLKNDYFICSANQINSFKELVLIFYNISELKKVENIKRDLVVNVSHELRTPLTVMKGYLETIEDTIGDENKKYLEIVINHTNRLINIVQDLLTVSMLEEKNLKLEYTDVDLEKFFNYIQATFEQKIKSKGLYLNINRDENLKHIHADEFKLEQMLINLIDNSIKYTDKGGVTVNAFVEKQFAVFEIIDTGIGIPAQDQSRVFERFYTVDKSRSRQIAGTGLGLSIVKHIVALHNGTISVESTIGSGSKFIIHLPF